jgi:hypothetical protein
MSTLQHVNGSSTERASSEVEYFWYGQQMVRELEMFLRAGLAHPQMGRHIPFLASRLGPPKQVSICPASPVKPVEE